MPPLTICWLICGWVSISWARVSAFNNKVVYSIRGQGPEVKFVWTDNDPLAGRNYFYVRVEQKDGQLCWSSPIWVEYP